MLELLVLGCRHVALVPQDLQVREARSMDPPEPDHDDDQVDDET